jgi:hypothetical protein
LSAVVLGVASFHWSQSHISESESVELQQLNIPQNLPTETIHPLARDQIIDLLEELLRDTGREPGTLTNLQWQRIDERQYEPSGASVWRVWAIFAMADNGKPLGVTRLIVVDEEEVVTDGEPRDRSILPGAFLIADHSQRNTNSAGRD